MYAGVIGAVEDFAFDLDDWLFARILKPDQLVGLKPEQIDQVRATLRSGILHSTEVQEHIKKNLGLFLERVKDLPDIVIIIIGGGGMYASQALGGELGQIGRPTNISTAASMYPTAASMYPTTASMYPTTASMYPTAAGMYPTAARGLGGFDDILIEKFLSPTEAASLTVSQLRVLSAMIKSEILFSTDVTNLLSEKVAGAIK